MNSFFRNLKEQTNGKITQVQFQEFLQDEEFIDGENLNKCFYCDYNKFDIFSSAENVYVYISERMSHLKSFYENDVEEMHQLALLCNWMNSKGIPIFADANKFPNLKIIVCKNCGKILGVKLNKWEYPYIGQMDEGKNILGIHFRNYNLINSHSEIIKNIFK